MILHSKLDEEKQNNAGLVRDNNFGSHSLPWLVKGAVTLCTRRMSVIIMIWLLQSASGWPIIIVIGPSGSLLVVAHLFAVQVAVLWVGLQKSKQLYLDVKNIFAGLHTEPHWRCSYFITAERKHNPWLPLLLLLIHSFLFLSLSFSSLWLNSVWTFLNKWSVHSLFTVSVLSIYFLTILSISLFCKCSVHFVAVVVL